MTWMEIRLHYEALLDEQRTRHGRTQHDVAKAGGLSGQNAISKLLRNTKRGPSVESFVKAIEGLGLSVTTFFATLDAQRPIADRRARISGASHDHSPPPAADQVPQDLADITEYDALVARHFRTLLRGLARLEHDARARMDASESGDGRLRTESTPTRRPNRRRA